MGGTHLNSDYCEELSEVYDLCAQHGLIFAVEMRWMCRAWRVLCHLLNETEDPTIAGPSRDDARTPGVRMMETAMTKDGSRLGQRTPTQPPPKARRPESTVDTGKFVKHTGEPPPPPTGLKTRKGPSTDDLLAIGRSEWITVKGDEMKFSTLKQRVSQANSRSKKDELGVHLVCWQQQDGTMVVRHG